MQQVIKYTPNAIEFINQIMGLKKQIAILINLILTYNGLKDIEINISLFKDPEEDWAKLYLDITTEDKALQDKLLSSALNERLFDYVIINGGD